MDTILSLPGCQIERGEFRGWQAIFLKNGLVTVVVVPDVGCRIMAYDLEPLATLETKRGLLSRAAQEHWTIVFEHDPTVALGRIEKDSKSYVCTPLDTPSGQT